MNTDEKFWENINDEQREQLDQVFDEEKLRVSSHITNSILEIMAQEKVSPNDLAHRLGSHRALITNTIKIGRNLTLLTLVKFLRVLGYRLIIGFEKIEKEGKNRDSKTR